MASRMVRGKWFVTSLMRGKWCLRSMVRGKWFMRCMSRQKAELIALVCILGVMCLVVCVVWEAAQPVDGTYIDLSHQHQEQIIDRYRKERRLQEELRQRQKEMNQGTLDDKDEEFFRDHVEVLPDARVINSDFNLSQHLRDNPNVISRRKKHIGDLAHGNNVGNNTDIKHNNRDTTTVRTVKKRQKYVKYYDPNQGQMVLKPVIVEDTELSGGRGHCHVYGITPNISERFDCMSLSIKPLTPICLYRTEQDIHISGHIRSDGVWEPHIVRDFQNILYGDPDLAVIDIGANIGQYSLIAAAMGHKVIAVEPYIENIKRLQAAAHEGGLHDRITVVQNAISDNRKLWYLHLWKNNQGGVSLQLDHPDVECTTPGCTAPSVNTIYMDDLLEVTQVNKAIMKIDIEGNEHRAFVHSEKLLDKVYVPYIFMEWMKLRGYHGSEISQSEDKRLTERLVRYLTGRGYHAYSSVTMEKLNPQWWVSWTDDIIWKHELHDIT